ncbi:MAG: hypothetical protein ABSG99_04815 [Sedimentisphaerales bacterium]
MKKITVLLLLFCMASSALGSVSTKVCLADGNTPLELADPCIPFVYRDIMVGTKLTIIIDSNVAEYWYGGALVVEEAEMANIGLLYGRGYDDFGYPGSCLPAAGEDAYVWETFMFPGPGFEPYGGSDPNVGDWFIFDYNALDIGDCNVSFYYYEEIEGEMVPILIHTLTFHHVRTCDFNEDTKVDFADFAVFASYWQATDCSAPGWCEGTDLDTDGNVDFDDLMLFCEYWLEKTE